MPRLEQGYREDDHLYLESDTDEQLLIHIPFSQGVPLLTMLYLSIAPTTSDVVSDVQWWGAVVKLQSIAIKSAAAEGRAPRRVKLFINRASLGFSEAADFAPVQVYHYTSLSCP